MGSSNAPNFHSKLKNTLREVTAISNLNHTNIVRYYTSWIEFDTELNGDESRGRDNDNSSIEKSSISEENYTKTECSAFEWEPASMSKEKSNVNSEEASREIASSKTDSKEETKQSGSMKNEKLSLYIQMEFCDGQNLKEFLENTDGNRNPLDLLMMFKQILTGVDEFHENGILHRDLK